MKLKFTSTQGGRDSPYRLHKVGSPCGPRSIYWDANEGNWADCMKSIEAFYSRGFENISNTVVARFSARAFICSWYLTEGPY